MWQHSHHYTKDGTSLILRGDQHYLLTENVVHFQSPKDAILIKPESLWVQLENSWVHSASLVTLPISQLSRTIYTNCWKNIHSNSGPSLGNISHIHEWERHHNGGCRRRSRFLVKCEWHCDIWHQCQGLYHWVTEGGDCMNPDICTESQVVLQGTIY